VGFEPTRLSPADLKSAPLDRSGNRTGISQLSINNFFKPFYKK
jgi:hypothetical protein